MVLEDDTHVLYGPEPYQSLKNISLGRLYYDALYRCKINYPAMIDAETNESISYRDLFEYSCILADYLQEVGYGKGSIMAISSHNNLQFFIPILSTLYLGAIMAPLNYNYTLQELQHTLNISKPEVIFCSERVLQKYLDLKKEFQFIERILVIDSTTDFLGTTSLINLLKKRRQFTERWRNFKPLDGKAEDLLCFILCSSGTTGLPKGVLLSQMNILLRLHHAKDPRYFQAQLGLKVLGILPFFHGFGLITSLGSIENCVQVVILKRFDERLFLETIQKYKINLLWLVPPLAVFLAKSPLIKKYDLSSVTEVLCAAAPLGKNIQEELKRRLSISKVFQGYGLTETTFAVTYLQQSDFYKEGSSGKVVPYMRCKVRDPESGKSLRSNQSGELCFKGPKIMVGYYGNEKATKESFTSDGWLRTGDLGYYDEEGFFFIVDRLKELIKYKGFQVAPAELEALLLKHPKICDCGVVGVPDELSGELPLAFVVKRECADLTEKDVQDYVAGSVSYTKHLRGGVIFVNEIPKNASGKILRRELKGLLNKYKSKL